jgi:hypothetical protein
MRRVPIESMLNGVAHANTDATRTQEIHLIAQVFRNQEQQF